MAKVLVICAQRYNGHELWTLLGELQEKGHSFEVVSTQKLIKDELTLRPNTIERTVYEVDPKEVKKLDGVIVVSGNMADTEAYWTDNKVQAIVKESAAQEKLTAAICCSVPTLWQCVKGKSVSFYPLLRSRERLERGGAILRTVALTVDGNIITAEHQMATQMWAQEICAFLEGEGPIHHLEDSKYVPKGRPRRLKGETERIYKALKRREQ